MAKQRLKSPRARLFVALDLADDLREGLARWQRAALGDDALRPMRPEGLHITLCFLSYHPERAIPRIAELITGVEPRPVPIRLEPDPIPIPKGRPRLFAVGVESEAAVELQAEVEEILARERFYVPEKRAFWPHITVARVRTERAAPRPGERRGKGRPRAVRTPPGRLPGELTNTRSAVRLALYRSLLKPSGAEYELLAALELPSPAGAKAKKR